MPNPCINLIGIQAELLVQYRLSLLGYTFHRVADCPYDLVGQIGSKLIRVQVKGTGGIMKLQSSDKYSFYLKHQKSRSNYTRDDVDVVALVALPVEQIY